MDCALLWVKSEKPPFSDLTKLLALQANYLDWPYIIKPFEGFQGGLPFSEKFTLLNSAIGFLGHLEKTPNGIVDAISFYLMQRTLSLF